MNDKYPQGGLASLLASRGRDGDSVLVHMTPGEVEGLQALAVANGGSLSVNPDTGLPEANFLKAILPAIAGSTLKTLFPKLGSATTGLIVGAATGLIDKSFDKGLRSGLSAYSGAKTMEGLAAARKAVQPGSVAPRITTDRGEELSAKRLMDKAPIDVSKLVVQEPVQVATVTKAPSLFGEMGEGIRALFKPEGQEAFLEAVEGPYKRQGLKDLSRSAYFAGLANLAATEPKKITPGAGSSGARFYIPGEVNPLYGQGYDQWYFKPGYFSDKYPGYAAGGVIPQQNGTFPMARVRNDGYEPATDTYTGEELFADGGEVMVSPQAVLPQQVTVYNPSFTQDREGLKNYYESLLVPPDTTPRDTSELQKYLDELNARLRRPYQPGSDYQYGALPTPGSGDGGGGGTSPTPGGTDPFATGVTGTPVDLIPTTKPPATPDKPDFSTWVPGSAAKPSDLIVTGSVPEFDTDPEGETSIEVIEGEIAPDYVGLPIKPIATTTKTEDPDTQTSIEVVEGDVASDYSGVPISVGASPELDKEKEGEVTVEEIDEQAVADEIRDRLSQDLGGPSTAFPAGYKPVEFTQPEYNIEVEEVADQEPAEEDKGITKEDVKNAGMKIAEQALRSAFPMAGLIYDIYKEVTAKEEPKGEVTVEEVKEGEEGEEGEKTEEKERADIAYTPSKGSGATFMNIGLGAERAALAKAAAAGTEDEGPEYSVGVEEIGGMAAGGRVPRFAGGGLGSLRQYAVGGKLVNGPGDGMSDDIKANISGVQEARLADGEFVIPADVVSHLGNGSTDAGAKQLYSMMDRIRKARTGRTRQAPEVEARKYMPA